MIKSYRADGVAVVRVTGTITIGRTATEFGAEIKKALSDGTTQLLLNLFGVTHMDSMAIGEIARTVNLLIPQEGKIKIQNSCHQIASRLMYTRLDDYIEVCNIEDEATMIKKFTQ